MTAILHAEATAYRQALFALIDKLVPRPDGESFDALLHDLKLHERRDWTAQQLIDVAMGAASSALYREEAAHEYARDRADLTLKAFDEFVAILKERSDLSAKEAVAQKKKPDHAYHEGISCGYHKAAVFAETEKAEISRRLTVGIPKKKETKTP